MTELRPDTRIADARSFLFAPAHRPERFTKALASGADCVVLDLEDSVPLASKDEARAAIVEHGTLLTAAACAVVVRINSPETEEGQRDMQALRGIPALSAVMVPKCDSADTVRTVAGALPGLPLLPIIESAAALLALPQIAMTSPVCRLIVGHIDFLADTGIQCSDDQRELDSLRFQVAICTRVAQLAPAVDGVTVAVDEQALIRADTQRAVRFGFGGKLCIHPKQVATVHESFMPDPVQVNWATRVIEAMQVSKGTAVQLDGKMVDLPVVLQAQRILSRVR